MTVINSPTRFALLPLICASSISSARPAYTLSRTSNYVSINLVVGMPLGAMCSISICIAFVSGLYAGSTLPMPIARGYVGIIIIVFMTLWAVGNVRLPTSTVSLFIIIVLPGRSPVQIAQRIVGWIVIYVAPLHLGRPRTNEILQYQSMDSSPPQLAIAIQAANRIPSIQPTGHRWLQNPPRYTLWGSPSTRHFTIKRANSAVIRYLVAWKSRHRQPSFITFHADYDNTPDAPQSR